MVAPAAATQLDLAIPTGFAKHVIDWQRHSGRHTLPWQDTRDPYRVWLSEVMLQQTQVTTVLGYYERFLQRFPTVADLAAAPLDDVYALWSGLGYYSRARNLHRCAQAVVAEHGGAFPRAAAVLATLPGIGRSTAAAIAAFCFDERVAILDGNVRRVLTRVLGFGADMSLAAPQRELWNAATALLPESGVAHYTQGLMDLGSGVCTTRSPTCLICPVRELCVAVREGEPERYPYKTRRTRRGLREHTWLWLRWGAQHWLTQRPDTGVWASLWSLCEFDTHEALADLSNAWPGGAEPLPSVVHKLTHLDWTLHPRCHTLPESTAASTVDAITRRLPGAEQGRWFSTDGALALGLPAPLRRLMVESV